MHSNMRCVCNWQRVTWAINTANYREPAYHVFMRAQFSLLMRVCDTKSKENWNMNRFWFDDFPFNFIHTAHSRSSLLSKAAKRVVLMLDKLPFELLIGWDRIFALASQHLFSRMQFTSNGYPHNLDIVYIEINLNKICMKITTHCIKTISNPYTYKNVCFKLIAQNARHTQYMQMCCAKVHFFAHMER